MLYQITGYRILVAIDDAIQAVMFQTFFNMPCGVGTASFFASGEILDFLLLSLDNALFNPLDNTFG